MLELKVNANRRSDPAKFYCTEIGLYENVANIADMFVFLMGTFVTLTISSTL